MNLPEAYAYLVVYDLGEGSANVFWASEILVQETGFTAVGNDEESVHVGWETPYIIKPKDRENTADKFVADREGKDLREVQQERTNA